MYTLSEQQIDYILNDIKTRGVEMEDLQLNLLDHICCTVECELQENGNFEEFYQQVITRFFKKELREIQEETILLLTFKNYFIMKNVMIRSGFVSVLLLVCGSLFKLMHWPGAGLLITLGVALLSLCFLPLVFILKIKDKSSSRDKFIMGIATLTGFFLSLATLFTIMHWPNPNGILWIITVSLSAFVLIPVYFFTGIRNPDTRLNTIVTTVALVGGTGLLFTLINLRPSAKQTHLKMYSYIQSEELLKKVQHLNHQKENTIILDINHTTDQIKNIIVGNMIGQSTIPKDFEKKQIFGEEEEIGDAFNEGRQGMVLFSHLKNVVKQYNETLAKPEEDKITLEHFQMDKLYRYNNYLFLNYLVQLQMYIATTENTVTASK